MLKFTKKFLLLAILFVVAGCSSDDENFVFTSEMGGNAASQGRLVFLTVPQRDAGQSFNTLQVGVQNFDGELLDVDVPITVGLVNPGNAILSGTTTQNAVNGVASFPDLSVDRVGNYEFTASSAGFESSESQTFEITPATVNQLSFQTQPTGVVANQAFSVAVEARDQFGNPANASVTLNLANAQGAVLEGPLTAETVDGVATFDNLSLTAGGMDFVLQATSEELPVVQSDPFSVVAPGPRMFVGQTGSISVFDSSRSGNFAPLRTISGSNTNLGSPRSFAVRGNELFVADAERVNGLANGRLLVFDLSASGNVAPIRTISGPDTGVRAPFGLLVVGDELFVAERRISGEGAILVFPIDAQGNVAPSRRIEGNDTFLSRPEQIATDGNRLYIADQIADQSPQGGVLVFPLSAEGNVAPLQFIRGEDLTNPPVATPFGIALSATEMFVSDLRGSDSIKVFPLDATGMGAASRFLNSPAGARYMSLFDNELYIMKEDGTVTILSLMSDATRTIGGSATGLTTGGISILVEEAP